MVNPSGGLISKGHPLGATGLAQCSELTWQLRGQADARQVDGAEVALQHNIGLGGAAVVSIYKPRPLKTPPPPPPPSPTQPPRPGTTEQRERLTQGYTELHNQEIYEKLADLGWLGVSIDEEYGGSGGGMVDRASSRGDAARPGRRSRATASA